jgi:hypothetical protein
MRTIDRRDALKVGNKIIQFFVRQRLHAAYARRQPINSGA